MSCWDNVMLGISLVGQLSSDKGYVGKMVVGKLSVIGKKREIDWKSTLEFISNRINFTSRQCNIQDTKDRSYRIKNLLKDLPVYETLYKRETNMIKDDKCRRCKKNEIESWEHIWVCEDNEKSLEDIAQETIYIFEETLIKKERKIDVEILKKFNNDFVRIILEPSKVLLGKNRLWEVLRGVYNNNLNDLTRIKEEKSLIKELWNFLYNEFKNRIWFQRCKEIARLEKIDSIDKRDLKRKRQNEESTEEGGYKKDKNTKTNKNIEKIKKIKLKEKINLATRTKLIGAISEGFNIRNNWDTIQIGR
ncbi:hypothetical protein C1646_748526 [Rhizophagus diaphanus]|nr:hypothetical protein C1646_748526 [Rhizophagus diaphanus] [Rhizophagus sp. MUCL 43196]